MALEHPVILTGSASGIGDATAKRLLDRGCKVISVDIKEPKQKVAEHHHCDMGDPAAIDALVKKLDGTYSSLLNVAGVPESVGGDTCMAINFFGLRMLTDALFDRIADGGTVVSVSSIAGNNWRKRRGPLSELLATEGFETGMDWWRKNKDAVGTDPYTFSKEAVVVYTMALAGRGLTRGIRVNDVGPGPVDTPLLPAFTEFAGAETMKTMIGMAGRAAQPEDIAEALVVLAEGEMGWVNGHHLIVDGGMSAGFSAGWQTAGK
ncbi:coniferyl-alcohol dehydrogenase [Minwuia thermotolerans]|uniref:3-alpha-hydroxysteroid dehydrogenase n=1 Tax=Minwuia thermotolerans TaxID=2056226 RepID=A0A2M9FVU7_9PROT|nr:coniferyl-alcohol dehydrogenase [Minwuia thermotolerans]PJK27574.1 3-alpha-hydroxysteroid dehydrogenase [Minwuia thermotolerans]